MHYTAYLDGTGLRQRWRNLALLFWATLSASGSMVQERVTPWSFARLPELFLLPVRPGAEVPLTDIALDAFPQPSGAGGRRHLAISSLDSRDTAHCRRCRR